MPTYMSDPNGSSQQNVFATHSAKSKADFTATSFILSSNISSDTGQIESLPSCRCQASVIVAAVTG